MKPPPGYLVTETIIDGSSIMCLLHMDELKDGGSLLLKVDILNICQFDQLTSQFSSLHCVKLSSTQKTTN